MKSAHPMVARLLAAALSLSVAGCAKTGRPLAGADPFSGTTTAAEIRIRVRNGNFYDATLTAISDMGRRRLGVVGGNQTAVFTTPWAFTSALRVQIDLLAGPTCTSDPITVSPGEAVTLEILNNTSSDFCR